MQTIKHKYESGVKLMLYDYNDQLYYEYEIYKIKFNINGTYTYYLMTDDNNKMPGVYSIRDVEMTEQEIEANLEENYMIWTWLV